MKRIVLIYGFWASLIVCTLMGTSMSMMDSPDHLSNGELIGYSSMLLAFSMIFIGIYRFREKENDGYISFKKAFQVGISIVLLTSTVYVIGWMIYSNTVATDFMEKYMAYQEQVYKEAGLSEAEVQEKMKEMQYWGEMYKNPLFKILLTYAEIFPLGLIITLIASLVLKKKRPQQPDALDMRT